MGKDARRDQRSVQIRRILRDKHQPVQQEPEQEKDDKRPEYPQLLTDHHQDHIILGLRDHPQLLGAVAQPFPEEPAASDGIQALHDLIASGIRRRLRIQPGNDPLEPEVIAVGRSNGQDRDPHDRNQDPGHNDEEERLQSSDG